MEVQECTVDLPTVTRRSLVHGVSHGIVCETINDGISSHSSRISKDK